MKMNIYLEALTTLPVNYRKFRIKFYQWGHTYREPGHYAGIVEKLLIKNNCKDVVVDYMFLNEEETQISIKIDFKTIMDNAKKIFSEITELMKKWPERDLWVADLWEKDRLQKKIATTRPYE